MQAESVQEGGKPFHQYKNADSKGGPGAKNEIKNDASIPILEDQTLTKNHHPQDFRKLCNYQKFVNITTSF